MFLGQEVSTLIDLSIWEGPLLCAQPWYTYGRLLMFSALFGPMNARTGTRAVVGCAISGGLTRADSAPTRVASGRTGFRAIAGIPLRARNCLHC